MQILSQLQHQEETKDIQVSIKLHEDTARPLPTQRFFHSDTVLYPGFSEDPNQLHVYTSGFVSGT